jgi:hypothetical protein
MNRSLSKLAQFVFGLTNDRNENSWTGVKVVELKSETFRRHGYIEDRSTKNLVTSYLEEEKS